MEHSTAAALEALQAHWPEQIRLTVDRSSDYLKLPEKLLPAFPRLTPEDIQPLMQFVWLYGGSILLHDDLADGDMAPGEVGTSAMRIMALQFEACRLLQPLFPPGSRLWERLRGYLAEYASTCLEECRFASGERPWHEYDEALARRIARGKLRVSHVIVAALVEMGQAEPLYTPLVEALDCLYVAAQFYDDLLDWKEDLRRGVPTLLLRRLLPERPGPLGPEELGRLSRELYYGGHAAHAIRLALASLDEAERLREHIPELPLYDLIALMRSKYQGTLGDVERLIHENRQRVSRQPKLTLRLPPAGSRWQRLAWAALRSTLQQWQLGFAEACDQARPPPHLSLEAQGSMPGGDVLQRALATGALSAADEALQGQLRPVLDHEAGHLVQSRLEHGFAGWSYFPTLAQLPPDTDTLAHVVLALLRSGHRAEVARHAEPALEVALRDCARPDGSFGTWLVPQAERTPLQQRHAELVERAWGLEADAAVTANLLYALQCYEPKRFAQVVQRGVECLAAQQLADGAWPSRRYHGPWYTLFACVRLLESVQPATPAASRALELLRSHQREDGGWGVEAEPSDPLSTALALLALAALHGPASQAEQEQCTPRALAFLESSKAQDDSWAAHRLVDAGFGRFHASRTVTTVLVLEAALAWHRKCVQPQSL